MSDNPRRIEIVLVRWVCQRGHNHLSERTAMRCNRPPKIKSPQAPSGYITTFQATRGLLWKRGVNSSREDIVRLAKCGALRYWRRGKRSPVYVLQDDVERIADSGIKDARDLIRVEALPP